MSRAARLAAELARRQRQREFSADALCFGPQLEFVRSRAKRKVSRNPRRSGKTTGVAVMLLDEALRPPYANQGYVTITLKNAKRLVWPVLKRLNREYSLGGVSNDAEGYMRFPHLPNEPHIYLGGANNKDELEKLRGWEGGVKRWVIDEAQSMRQMMLEELVDDVIEPSLFDYDGELSVIGTPGPIRAGYFWNIDQGEQRHAWSHFSWTMADNPWLEKKSGKPVAQLLKELLERRKWTVDHPSFRREYMGEWVEDRDALMFHYDKTRNACEWQREPKPDWVYILIFDQGYDDADAVGVLGWPRHQRRMQLCEEVVRRGQGVTELGNQLTALYNKFHPISVIGDLGGLGKKIGVEYQKRWGIPVEAADKSRKAEHIFLLDDALQTGAFQAPPDSQFAQDCAILQWDQEKKAKGVYVEDSAYHSDACDMVLYGYRKGLHYLEQPAPEKPKDEGDRLLQARIERIEREKNQPWWERSGGRLGF